MGKCLNCGKEVGNKYCNVTCQNEHKGKLNKEKYYLNPKLCLNCKQVISYESKRNKFCSHSCAATFNNVGTKRNKLGLNCSNKDYRFNSLSDDEFINLVNTSTSFKNLTKKLGYTNTVVKSTKNLILEKINKLNISVSFEKDIIKNKSKKEIFTLSKNWQSARTAIRKDACKVFENSNKEYKCIICGYDKHVEIAHIKAVSDFDDSATLEEINHVDNLIGLCPTHHWEFDAGLIDLNTCGMMQ